MPCFAIIDHQLTDIKRYQLTTNVHVIWSIAFLIIDFHQLNTLGISLHVPTETSGTHAQSVHKLLQEKKIHGNYMYHIINENNNNNNYITKKAIITINIKSKRSLRSVYLFLPWGCITWAISSWILCRSGKNSGGTISKGYLKKRRQYSELGLVLSVPIKVKQCPTYYTKCVGK